MDLSIVIVNWNSGDQLRACLASIGASAAQLPPGCTLTQVVVVDNGSLDGSDQHLSVQSCRLRLMRNDLNRGFAASCNQGAASLGSDLILLSTHRKAGLDAFWARSVAANVARRTKIPLLLLPLK